MSQIEDFDFSVDLLRSLLWQHDNAEGLVSIARSKQSWYEDNQSSFWENWVTDVFDLRTANDFGCTVWSIILGIPLAVTQGANVGKPTWAFGALGRQNFERGNFSNTQDVTIPLTLAQKRLVLRLRYFQLIARGTVPETNRFLKSLFSDQGDVYVIDNYDMSFALFIFGFQPDSELIFILQKYDLMPRPAGVGVAFEVPNRPVFGFDDNLNFDNGTFTSGA